MADRKAKPAAAKKAAAKPAATRKLAVKRAAAKPVRVAAKAAIPKPAAAAAVSRKAFEAAERAFEATNQTIEKGTKTMTNDTIKKVQATQAVAAERMQAVFGDVNERAKTAMEKNGKLVEEMTEFTKGNVEALVASSKVVAKGVETLGQEAADYGRRSFEEASAALKSFAEVKSPTDFFKLQSDYARSAFDSLVTESSKMSEAMLKLAGDVAEPITSRYSVAAERVKKIAA